MFKKKKLDYHDGWIDYPGKGIIYDRDVAKFVKKHLRFRDRFNFVKVTESILIGQSMLMGVEDIPEGDWVF